MTRRDFLRTVGLMPVVLTMGRRHVDPGFRVYKVIHSYHVGMYGISADDFAPGMRSIVCEGPSNGDMQRDDHALHVMIDTAMRSTPDFPEYTPEVLARMADHIREHEGLLGYIV